MKMMTMMILGELCIWVGGRGGHTPIQFRLLFAIYHCQFAKEEERETVRRCENENAKCCLFDCGFESFRGDV